MEVQAPPAQCLFLYRNTKDNFLPKQFPSIGTTLIETYVNIVKPQFDKLNELKCIMHIY